MKILHIFDHSLPLQSGYTFRSMAILRAQRERGWQTVQLTTPRHGASLSTQSVREDYEGYTFWRTAAPDSWISRTPLWPLAEMRATRKDLHRLASAERPDVIHAHSPSLNAHPALDVSDMTGSVTRHVQDLEFEPQQLHPVALDQGRERRGDALLGGPENRALQARPELIDAADVIAVVVGH